MGFFTYLLFWSGFFFLVKYSTIIFKCLFNLSYSNKQVAIISVVKGANIDNQVVPKLWYNIENIKCNITIDRKHKVSIFIPIEDAPLQIKYANPIIK